MFRFLWLKRIIRRRMKPMPGSVALQWKKRLSFAYTFFAWNTLGLIAYYLYQGRDSFKQAVQEHKDDVPLTPAAWFAVKFNMDKAKIKRIQGFRDVGTTEFVLEDYYKEVDEAKKAREAREAEEALAQQNEDNKENNVTIVHPRY